MTAIQLTSIAELLETGRGLIVKKQFHAEVVLEFLDRLSTTELDVQTRGAVQHARIVAIDVFGGNSHTAIARFALSRVIMLLEEHNEKDW